MKNHSVKLRGAADK